MFEVKLQARDITPFIELVGTASVEQLTTIAREVRQKLGARTVWNVSSTAAGGGVAEMLHPLLSYARGQGLDVRWVVIEGPPAFFAITKRIHNALHDTGGDGSLLGAEQAALYERVSADNMRSFDERVRPGDVVICHDPQTAGLVPALMEKGARVVWRCHIGHEGSGADLERGWEFLRKYLAHVPTAVFSRDAYAPSWLPRTRAVTLPPNIDPFSLKSRWLSETATRAILCAGGLVDIIPCEREAAIFVRDDGSTGHVIRSAIATRAGRAPRADAPLITQISRWDRMKDHAGVLAAFTSFIADMPESPAELLLVGPASGGVADDPEADDVLADLERRWRASPPAVRARSHIVQLPMADVAENAVMVNALQCHSSILVQKSLREGFGLSVTEAMWKGRPVVASAVGGIRDQIRDGIDGLLVSPTDPRETARAFTRIMEDPELGRRLGASAHTRVADEYLVLRSLIRWANLFLGLLAPVEAPSV